MISFEVLGDPSPQGSKKHVGHGVMVESSKTLKSWRRDLADAARQVVDEQLGGVPLDGPLHLDVLFRFPMPASRSATIRAEGVGPKTTAPDLDKLVRAVGDALKVGGLIVDDARFCSLAATKVEVVGWSGAVVSIDRAGRLAVAP